MNPSAAIAHQRAYLRRIHARHQQAVAEKDVDLATDLTYAARCEEAELQRMLAALARSTAGVSTRSAPAQMTGSFCLT